MTALIKLFLYKCLIRFIPDYVWVCLQYRRSFGCFPNLKNPKTFNEKLQWLKLYKRDSLYTQLVDKYKVREYIAKKIGADYLIPLLGVWNNFEDIDFDALPNQFVLKCTHDSGGLVICTNKSKLDIEAARKKINLCLKMNYYWSMREWPYKNVKPKIIAEKYMATDSCMGLNDYKFFCFNGTPYCVLVCSERFSKSGLKEDFFDMEWNKMNISRPNHDNSSVEIPIPPKFDEMKIVAKNLSEKFVFSRIDLFEIQGKVFFGEITFYPASGLQGFEPNTWDLILGEKINLGDL